MTQRTPKPPPITPRQLHGAIAAAVIAVLVVVPWLLVTGPLRPFELVGFTMRGSEDSGRVLLISPTVSRADGCDEFHTGVASQYPDSPVTINVRRRLDWKCPGSAATFDAAGQPRSVPRPVFRVALDAPLGTRGVTGPGYVEATPAAR